MAVPAIRTRRTDILDAAIGLVATAGLRGLTHRGVDAAAKLPEGSTSAYFRTRLTLLTGVVQRLSERIGADVDELAAEVETRPGDPDFALERAVALVGRWLADPAPLTARLELSLEATRRPELQEAMAAWRVAFEELVERILREAGVERPKDHAGLVVACVDGVLLRSLLAPSEQGRAVTQRQGVEQATALLTALRATLQR